MKRTMLAHPENLWNIHTDFDATNGYRTKMSPCNQTVPVAESQQHIINSTNSRCALNNCVKARLHVSGRAADDAEHLSRCGLMLQGLAQFCVALLQFLEQTDVLNCDDCLMGEDFKKSYLLLGEGPNFR